MQSSFAFSPVIRSDFRMCAPPNCPSSTPPLLCDRRRALSILLAFPCAAVLTMPSSPSRASVRLADVDAGSRVVSTPSGLRYYDFVVGGDGNDTEQVRVDSGQIVVMHYTFGTTGARNGWKLDTTYKRQPFVFTMGAHQVILGLEEALVGMRVHGRRRCLVPPHLGFKSDKDRPVPPGFAEYQRFKNIYLNNDRQYKPDAVFDIELLRIRRDSS